MSIGTTHLVPPARTGLTECCRRPPFELPRDDQITEVKSLCTCKAWNPNPTRLCHLERMEDVSGISGTGTVAYGAIFPDGSVVLRWDTRVVSTVFYHSVDDLLEIVGHGGKTKLVYDT